ncbi:MAG: hypothetical protein FRX49_06370 [Trebouxia sp. A1-2]|nr:MAG: hypothetical protein FRX49_06370 [Trebouxia sp. A1-2]
MYTIIAMQPEGRTWSGFKDPRGSSSNGDGLLWNGGADLASWLVVALARGDSPEPPYCLGHLQAALLPSAESSCSCCLADVHEGRLKR